MFLLIPLFLAIFSFNFNSYPLDQELVPSKEEILRVKDEDIILGMKEAENVIIEYSSLACPHCAEYYNKDFPQVKKELINSGRVKYVYRDFPTTRSALYATALARCLTKEANQVKAEDFFRILQLLFKSQSSWAFNNKYQEQLHRLFSLGGFEQEKIDLCSHSKEEDNQAIVAQAFLAIKSLDIVGAPALFLNGKALADHNFDKIKEQLK